MGRLTRVLAAGGLALVMMTVGYGGAGAAGTRAPQLAAASETISGATDLAWQWVRSMMGSPTVVTTESTISPTEIYDYGWTGPITGTFDLSGFNPLTVNPSTVVVDGDPSIQSAATFSGVVTGRVNLPTATDRWIIQAYRVNDSGVQQVPLQTMTLPDGTFRIDLAAVSNPPVGTWSLGVLDALDGYRPAGIAWPAPGTYQDLEVVSFATTDATYRTGAVPAPADGTFSFPASSPGVKSFQLIQPSTGNVIAEYRPVTGLVRSYGPDSAIPETTFTYDQALALQTAMVTDDASAAALLVEGLMNIQTVSGPQTGGFVAASPQLNPGGADQQYFTGNHAVALYALASYLRFADHDPALEAAVRSSIEAGLNWLEAQRISSGPREGLYAAGWSNGPLDWAAIEHNVDAWQALRLAAQVLPCSQCQARADQLGAALLAVMWNQQNSRFDQGARADGRDTVDPLDGNSWGAIFLTGVGESGKAALALANTENFTVTHGGADGYLAYRDQPMRPIPVPAVWVEGSAGVALAHARAGDSEGQSAILQSLQALQQPNGSFPMATAFDSSASLVTATSVAATSWFVLATVSDSPDSLWN